MNTEELIEIESSEPYGIHLIGEGTFFRAYERSAFLFGRHIHDRYALKSRFIKKVAKDLVYLGFPRSSLDSVMEVCKKKNFAVSTIGKDHVFIGPVPVVDHYDMWHDGVMRQVATPTANFANGAIEKGRHKSRIPPNEYALFRLFFDFTLYVLKAVSKFDKDYKYSFVEMLCKRCVKLLEILYKHVNNIRNADLNFVEEELYSLRLDFRLLCDLRQISLKQWAFINTKIEEMLENCMPESAVSRNVRERIMESSESTLAL